MGSDAPVDVITDTSTLVNFLRIDRVDLLAGLSSYRFVVTDHVRSEVTSIYQDQLTNFEFAIFSGHIVAITVDDSTTLELFRDLKKEFDLGAGETASIAVALLRGVPLAIDDRLARKKVAARYPQIQLIDTVGLVVEAIKSQLLTVTEADAIKSEWEQNHRFAKKYFSSFAELLA